MTDSGRTFTGIEALRGWSNNQLIGAKGRVTVQSEEPSATGTTLNVEYASSVYYAPGRYLVTIRDNRIQHLDLV